LFLEKVAPPLTFTSSLVRELFLPFNEPPPPPPPLFDTLHSSFVERLSLAVPLLSFSRLAPEPPKNTTSCTAFFKPHGELVGGDRFSPLCSVPFFSTCGLGLPSDRKVKRYPSDCYSLPPGNHPSSAPAPSPQKIGFPLKKRESLGLSAPLSLFGEEKRKELPPTESRSPLLLLSVDVFLEESLIIRV